MEHATVPDFFQEQSADALRSQVDWLNREIGVDNAFFARLVGTEEKTFARWRTHGADLPASGEETLCLLWRTVLHLLSFLNFDRSRVRELFQYQTTVGYPDEELPLSPPWGGESLKAYLERSGVEAIESVDGWVTGLRFGDLYVV